MKKTNIYSLLLAIFAAFNLNAQQVKVLIPEMAVDKGQVFSMDIKVSDFENMSAVQFALFWEANVIEFQSVSNLNPNMPDLILANCFNLTTSNEGYVYFIWSWFDQVNNVGVTLNDNAVLFTVNFKAVGNNGTSSNVEMAQDNSIDPPFYLEFASYVNVVEVAIDNGKVTISGVNATEETITEDFILFQNSPNPFLETTYISFNLNTGTDAKLTIFDSSGKAVMQQNKFFPAGKSRIPVRRDMLMAAGSYFYTLETTRATATRQLIMQ